MTFLNNSDRQTLKELIEESIREVLKEEQPIKTQNFSNKGRF
jgi:hypothetical protein